MNSKIRTSVVALLIISLGESTIGNQIGYLVLFFLFLLNHSTRVATMVSTKPR